MAGGGRTPSHLLLSEEREGGAMLWASAERKRVLRTPIWTRNRVLYWRVYAGSKMAQKC